MKTEKKIKESESKPYRKGRQKIKGSKMIGG